MPYATKEDVEAWADREVPDVDRKIRNAEILLADVMTQRINDPSVFDAEETDALRDAVCAQIEFWEQVGPEHETGGVHGKAMGVNMPGRLARRARSILLDAGLMTQAVLGVR